MRYSAHQNGHLSERSCHPAANVLQALAIVFALAAVLCIAAAIVMLVRQDANEQRGYALRVGAVVCFGVAVLLNVLR